MITFQSTVKKLFRPHRCFACGYEATSLKKMFKHFKSVAGDAHHTGFDLLFRSSIDRSKWSVNNPRPVTPLSNIRNRGAIQ